ncbi:MAG TPA: formate--tetrahydrofolate ligase [Candidatus Polarisedimenticolia bacterium]|nr:formate--tetrahydrofolate ligase [Candidatus Polarisedimenticolia bacterium]
MPKEQPADYVIATQALKKMRPIEEIARAMGLPTGSADFFSYNGRYAKVSHRLAAERQGENRNGKVILVTGMNPTPAGSGKTLTTITLTDGLNLLFKRRSQARRASFVLREPSMGPTLSVKGGACGGGYSQVLPMEEINLHFTGDIAAVTETHNLLWCMLMAYLSTPGERKRIALDSIEWPRAVDLCDRSLRQVVLAPEGRIREGKPTLRGGSVITAASELMAVLGLASDMEDLGTRLGRIRVARYEDGTPVTAASLGVVGAMQALLKQAINPNFVQTIAGSGGFIHTGPFANIAHGNSSLVALALARKHADFVVTEGGFGADLGAQKFFDVVCRLTKVRPGAAVLVFSTRDLKYHGGAKPVGAEGSPGQKWRFAPDREACLRGMENLKIHAENLKAYGVRVVAAMNRFAIDEEDEVRFCLKAIQERLGIPAVVQTGHSDGAEGGLELAEAVVREAEASGNGESFKMLYPDDAPLKEKIEAVARTIYRAEGVEYAPEAASALERIEAEYSSRLNVVLSKTQFSLSDNKDMLGVPPPRKVKVTGVLYRGGAGWVTVLLGDVLLMPGTNYDTCAARRLNLKADPEVFGGFIVENLQ